MNIGLKNLHNQLNNAYINKNYLNLTSSKNNPLTTSSLKNTKMADVFQKAQQEIQRNFAENHFLYHTNIEETAQILDQLKKDGENLYRNYTKKSVSFRHQLCKLLLKITPQFINRYFLPNYFQLEKDTKNSYDQYINILNEKSTRLDQQKQEILALLRDGINQLNLMQSQPVTASYFKNILEKQILKPLLDLGPVQASSKLEEWFRKENILSLYPLYQHHRELIQTLNSHQDQVLNDLMQNTPWIDSIQEALSPKQTLTIGSRQIANEIILSIFDASKTKVSEKFLQDYRGELIIDLPTQSIQLLSTIIHLIENQNLRPCFLKINLKHSNLTSEEFNIIFKFKNYISTVEIEGLDFFNLNDLHLTDKDAEMFIYQLKKICPDFVINS